MSWGTLATDLQDLLSFLSGEGLEYSKFEGWGELGYVPAFATLKQPSLLMVCAMETTCLLMYRAGARHGQIFWSCPQSTHDLCW